MNETDEKWTNLIFAVVGIVILSIIATFFVSTMKPAKAEAAISNAAIQIPDCNIGPCRKAVAIFEPCVWPNCR